jgi:hypothetical protein
MRARTTLLKDRAPERPNIVQVGAVRFAGVGSDVEEPAEDAARRPVDFAVSLAVFERRRAT